MSQRDLKIIECPRDAMQGIEGFIKTEDKIRYINSLLRVGFDTIDFGSFVSPKAVPQMADTADVVNNLDISQTDTKLLAIVANERGARDAAEFEPIRYLGYPFSISEIFQKRNTNKTIEESLDIVRNILKICDDSGKQLVVYISMGFGNPYREKWSADIVEKYCDQLAGMGIKILSLSDTIGTANPENIEYLFSKLIPDFPGVEIGAHLHTTPDSWREKVQTAYDNGCRRFDGAIQGFGGCPFADDELVGNMPTEKLLTFAQQNNLETGVSMTQFETAYNKAMQVFPA